MHHACYVNHADAALSGCVWLQHDFHEWIRTGSCRSTCAIEELESMQINSKDSYTTGDANSWGLFWFSSESDAVFGVTPSYAVSRLVKKEKII